MLSLTNERRYCDENSEWHRARVELLDKEKALTKLRDEVNAARRQIPWRKIEAAYEFTDEAGRQSLQDLFGSHSQLVSYRYMCGPGWSEGCLGCSFWADQYDAVAVHLAARDVALAVVSRAPFEDFSEFKTRMGWQFRWLSSATTSFNMDFSVSFPGQSEETYNYAPTNAREELPGVSIFAKDNAGEVFRTYSAHAGGLDPLNARHQVLDSVTKGITEEALPYPMGWVRFHARYED